MPEVAPIAPEMDRFQRFLFLKTMPAFAEIPPEVAQVVAYEIAAFDRLSGRLRLSSEESGSFIPEEITLVGTGHSDEDKWELSTEIESLLVHTRIMRDFFYYFLSTDYSPFRICCNSNLFNFTTHRSF